MFIVGSERLETRFRNSFWVRVSHRNSFQAKKEGLCESSIYEKEGSRLASPPLRRYSDYNCFVKLRPIESLSAMLAKALVFAGHRYETARANWVTE